MPSRWAVGCAQVKIVYLLKILRIKLRKAVSCKIAKEYLHLICVNKRFLQQKTKHKHIKKREIWIIHRLFLKIASADMAQKHLLLFQLPPRVVSVFPQNVGGAFEK